MALYLEHVEVVIINAKNFGTDLTQRWIQPLGTRVYLLVESILRK
jgi:hypothetical protein